MADELPELLVTSAARWWTWLGRHHGDPTGVWLVIAKKGTTTPTSVTYEQALEAAVAHGWIDGQIGRRDAVTYRQRFTARRPRSRWSQGNVRLAERLIAEGRMHPAGQAQVDAARSDGRWEAAYAGQAAAEVPPDLAAALDAVPAARARFDTATSQNRYSVIHRVGAAKRADTRARRIEKYVDMLARGETIHPEK
jgi:uncharacterized protein YdeI (YjbR/CyaY-like superfamily)